MYDPIYNEDVPEDEAPQFVTKDSGKMAEYASGMRRDTTEGKPQFRLMWPKDVPYEEQLIYRVAMLYMRGAEKYGDRNWEKSCTPEDLAHHEDALERHFHKFTNGVEDGEDHAAAIVWNVNAVLLTRRNIAKLESARQQALLDELAKPEPGFNQVKVWVPGGGSVEIDGHLRTNPADEGKVMVFPFFPPADVMVGRVYSREDTDKMLGRETAEHSSELDATFRPLAWMKNREPFDYGNFLPCIVCGRPKCRYGQGRCTECELVSQSPPMPTEQQPVKYGINTGYELPDDCVPRSQPQEEVRPVHHVPLESDGRMPCCGQTPFERQNDLLTTNPELVTCSRTADPMPWEK